MSHVAQEQSRRVSSGAGTVPMWMAWQLLFLVGVGAGMNAAGYSVFDAIKALL